MGAGVANGLTTKQAAFVAAYIGPARLNATKAAVIAGYSPKTAGAIGAENLTKPEIQAVISAWRDEVKQSAITDVSYRVARLHELESKLWDVVDARSEAYRNTNVIGGDTGIVVLQYKMIGGGENAQLVEEYQADTALAKAIQGVYDDVAKEMGQRVEKREHSGPDGMPLTVVIAERPDGPS